MILTRFVFLDSFASSDSHVYTNGNMNGCIPMNIEYCILIDSDRRKGNGARTSKISKKYEIFIEAADRAPEKGQHGLEYLCHKWTHSVDGL